MLSTSFQDNPFEVRLGTKKDTTAIMDDLGGAPLRYHAVEAPDGFYVGRHCDVCRKIRCFMTATVPAPFDATHAQQDLQDWDHRAPVGREFGSPDYERLEELDTLVCKTKGSLLAARHWQTHQTRNWTA